MDHFAGPDVSVKETSVCIVDDTRFKRIGLEAGPLSQWLCSALAEAELPVVCVETRHMQALLKAQINKTDRNDARGIAQMMRVELYRPVHVKTLRSQKLRMLLTHRKLLQSKAIAIENDLRGTLRNFCLKDPKRLITRVGNDFSSRFPFIAMAVGKLPVRSCLIDGEAIVCDQNGLEVFDLVRRHGALASAVHCAFDAGTRLTARERSEPFLTGAFLLFWQIKNAPAA